MKTTNSFHNDSDRYEMDFGPCSFKKGFAQVDNTQDAWYFGQWANPTRLIIVTYAEGDLSIQQAESDAEFVAEMKKIRDWDEFKRIDPMENTEIQAAFEKLGLHDMLYLS